MVAEVMGVPLAIETLNMSAIDRFVRWIEPTWATCRTYKQNAVPRDKDAPDHCVCSLKRTFEARFVRIDKRLFRVECLLIISVGLALLTDEDKIRMRDEISAINPFQLLVRHGVWGKGVWVGEGAVSRGRVFRERGNRGEDNAPRLHGGRTCLGTGMRCSSTPWVTACTIR